MYMYVQGVAWLVGQRNATQLPLISARLSILNLALLQK